MIEQQQKLMLSPYMEIYELVIPKDNLLRQIKELVDFSFIYDELLANYCLDNGRNAVPPIRMFKYLLLKRIYLACELDCSLNGVQLRESKCFNDGHCSEAGPLSGASSGIKRSGRSLRGGS